MWQRRSRRRWPAAFQESDVASRDVREPVVDSYEGALVINDYRIDPTDQTWLDALAEAARDALDAKHVFIKRRERLTDRREGHQYERIAKENEFRIVHEGGQKFRVNLGDYVDTGLFLDHRITRARVAAEPGTSLLNLFAYTGAFSVHAAAAGKATTSVDLSNTYTEWARANLELNGLRGEIIVGDVREFLTDARRGGRRWDIAIVDPPTFSNSKRMDYTWDLQRDHALLLDDVAAVADIIWFSTNRQRFKLEYERGVITDETRATTPPDFRGKPHRSYRITK
jgi:23S rRNA G2069 N7-methylase RlmK/C1962 C5-methylase RlmI